MAYSGTLKRSQATSETLGSTRCASWRAPRSVLGRAFVSRGGLVGFPNRYAAPAPPFITILELISSDRSLGVATRRPPSCKKGWAFERPASQGQLGATNGRQQHRLDRVNYHRRHRWLARRNG